MEHEGYRPWSGAKRLLEATRLGDDQPDSSAYKLRQKGGGGIFNARANILADVDVIKIDQVYPDLARKWAL